MGKDFEDQLGEADEEELDASAKNRRREAVSHAKDYAKNYNDQVLMGSGTGLEELGLQADSIAATSSNNFNTPSKNEKKRFHDLLQLIERIDWLNEQIERLADEIKFIEEDIATKEDLFEAIKEGRELTPEQQKLAAQYLDENGEVDMHALVADIEDQKYRLQKLKDLKSEHEAELDKLEKEAPVLKAKLQNGQDLSSEEFAAVLGSEEHLSDDDLDAAIDGFSDGDSEFGEFMKDKLALLESGRSTFAGEISESPIRVEGIRENFNAAANPAADQLTLDVHSEVKPVSGYTP